VPQAVRVGREDVHQALVQHLLAEELGSLARSGRSSSPR
jgi:hypothetical protein